MASPAEIFAAADQLAVDLMNAGGVKRLRDGTKETEHFSLDELGRYAAGAAARDAAESGSFYVGDPGLAGY